MSKSFSLYLDLMRFSAAIFVVLSHLVQMNIIQGNYAYFTPELGRDAVILFFVLSGYVIAYTTEYKKPSLVEYSIARMTRIYSVVIPLLLLSFISFVTLSTLNLYDGFSYVYHKIYFYYPFYMTFLGEIWLISETPPLLTPYWSLMYEVWYYIFFAIIYFFSGWKRILLALLIFLLIGYKLWLLAPIWTLGVVLYNYDHKCIFNQKESRLLFVFSFLIFIYFKLENLDQYLIEYGKNIWGFDKLPLGSASDYLNDYIVCMIVLMNFYFAKHANLEFLCIFELYIRSFSEYTFTLYLTHWLVLRLFGIIFNDIVKSGYSFIYVVILIFLSTFIIGQLTEKKRYLFSVFFKWIYRKILVFFRLYIKKYNH